MRWTGPGRVPPPSPSPSAAAGAVVLSNDATTENPGSVRKPGGAGGKCPRNGLSASGTIPPAAGKGGGGFRDGRGTSGDDCGAFGVGRETFGVALLTFGVVPLTLGVARQRLAEDCRRLCFAC